MRRTAVPLLAVPAPLLAAALALALLIGSPGARAASTAPIGKVQGRLVATDSGEPIGFADIRLLPADTTLRPVGGLTNADGTYLLQAAAGRYTLQVTALSYARKRVEGLVIESGQTAAVQHRAHARGDPAGRDRRRGPCAAEHRRLAALGAPQAASVGDAVSAEQVRRSPDKDAAEVLRRVTGLSVSEGRYVFVRGLGERYSSTEVDGVRIASPEQNRRVVPLDIAARQPARQHRGAEDLHVRPPGASSAAGTCRSARRTFPASAPGRSRLRRAGPTASRSTIAARTPRRGTTRGAYGAAARGLPGAVDGVAIPLRGRPRHLAAASRPREGVQPQSGTRTTGRAAPNAAMRRTYGDELSLFGRPLGLIQSGSFAHSFDRQDESQRFFQNRQRHALRLRGDPLVENAQLGGLSALSWRLSPRHSVHLRGF